MKPVCLAFAALLAFAATSGAVACSRELQVGLSELGYAAYQQQGQWRGIVPDVLAELSQRSGCRFKLVARPRARLLLEFEHGQLDILTSMLQAPDRDRLGQFLPYAYTEEDMLVLGAPVPRSLDELAALPGAKLGVVRGIRLGARLSDEITAMLASRQAEYSPDFENLAAKMRAGRVKAVLAPLTIHAKLRHDGVIPAHAVVVDLHEAVPEPIGFYVNRQGVVDDDAQLLARHMEAMRRDGRVVAAYRRHLGDADTTRLFGKAEAR